MAALDFPTSPSVGQKYPSPPVTGQPVYTWDGEKWTSYALPIGGGGVSMLMQDTPPTGVPDGSFWLETDTGLLFFRWNDGNSTQWVSLGTGIGNAVRYDIGQGLTTAQQQQATTNIAAVSYNTQTLTTPQQQQATTNIDAVSYNLQTPVIADQTQARANIGASSFEALANNNIILNGGMEVSQQFGTAATNTTPYGSWVYMLDQWLMYTAGSGTFATQQMGLTSTPIPGFRNAIRMYCGTAYTTPGANDLITLSQWIEGTRFAKLGFGTATPQSVTISFWVYSNVVSGTMTVGLRNLNGARSYLVPVTVTSGLPWQYKTVTIPGDTAGTWANDTTQGANIVFTLYAGTSFVTPNANVWQAANYYGLSGAANFYLTSANEVWITGVTMYPGTVGPTAAQSPLVMRSYADDLNLCLRYYVGSQQHLDGNPYGGAGAIMYFTRVISPPMRITPVGTVSAQSYSNASALGVHSYGGPNNIRFQMTVTAAGAYYAYFNYTLNSRL